MESRPCTCGECSECLRIMRMEEMGIYNRSHDTPMQVMERERIHDCNRVVVGERGMHA